MSQVLTESRLKKFAKNAPAAPEAPVVEEQKVVAPAQRISWPMAITLRSNAAKAAVVLGFPVEFEIVGKTGKGRGANYTLNLNGVAMKPNEASELIGAIKDLKK